MKNNSSISKSAMLCQVMLEPRVLSEIPNLMSTTGLVPTKLIKIARC